MQGETHLVERGWYSQKGGKQSERTKTDEDGDGFTRSLKVCKNKRRPKQHACAPAGRPSDKKRGKGEGLPNGKLTAMTACGRWTCRWRGRGQLASSPLTY